MKYKNKKHGLLISLLLFMLILSSVNVYAAPGSVTAYIPISCVGKNTSEEFIYKLKNGAAAGQTGDVIDTLKLTAGKKSTFSVTYTNPGTYEYEVVQEKGTDQNTVYDDSLYKAVVYVTEDDEGLSTEVIAYKSGSDQKVSELTFQNEKKEDNTNKGDKKKDTPDSEKKVSPGKNTKGAKTGDIANLAVCLGGTVAALLVVVMMLIKRRGRM